MHEPDDDQADPLEHAENATAVAEEAEGSGAAAHVVDEASAMDRMSAIDAIAEALSFPSYFGRNLDALYDCLVDLSWLPAGEHVLIWPGSDRLRGTDPRAYQGIRSALADAVTALAGRAEHTRTLRVVLTDR
jgi:hypothetical protein